MAPACGRLGNVAAFANMLKGLVGLGILALPYATTKVGWLFSLVGMALIALATAWGIFCCVLSAQLLDGEAASLLKSGLKESYGNDAEAAPEGARAAAAAVGGRSPLVGALTLSEQLEEPMDTGLGFFDGVVAKVYGRGGQLLCTVCIFMVQFATGVAYVDVIASSVEPYLYPYFGPDGGRTQVLLALTVVLSAFSTVESLQGVAVLSMLAFLVYFWVFGGLISEVATSYATGTLASTRAVHRLSAPHFGAWFGICSFAFGGLPIAMVIYEEMSDPRSFYKVISLAFFVCWVFYSVFAVLGYTCYGASTATVVYFNFAEHSILGAGSVVSVTMMLLLTYVLQMFPIYKCAQIICSKIPQLENLSYVRVRTLVVLSTVVVAYVMPNTIVVLDVLGGIAGSITSFILPAAVFLKVKRDASLAEKSMCWLMMVLGGAGGIMATM